MTEAEFTIFLSKVFDNLVTASADGAIHYVCMDWRHVGVEASGGGARPLCRFQEPSACWS